jgi:hypothetical protein
MTDGDRVMAASRELVKAARCAAGTRDRPVVQARPSIAVPGFAESWLRKA